MILLYITCKDEEEAVKISKYLLNKRLIACSNIHPTRSMYWWKEKIQDEKEFVIIAKTLEKNYKKIKEEVKKLIKSDSNGKKYFNPRWRECESRGLQDFSLR